MKKRLLAWLLTLVLLLAMMPVTAASAEPKRYEVSTLEELIAAVREINRAGGENIITKEDIRQFAEAGADISLLPAPGTVPGITTEYVRKLISYAHRLKKLTITSIGTSQEGADTDTIKRIALECKMAGTDIHHIGDSGYVGMALPENIMAYGTVIRGIRHQYHRMAQSIRR